MNVYGITSFVPGQRGQQRVIVAAKSKAAAIRAMLCGAYAFSQYGQTTGNTEELAVALAKPGTAFFRPLDHRGSGGWKEL